MSILDYQNNITTVSLCPALVELLQSLLHTKNYSETIFHGIAYYFFLSPNDLYIKDDFCLRQLLSAEERHTKKNYSIRFEKNFTCHFPNPKEENNEKNKDNDEDINEKDKENANQKDINEENKETQEKQEKKHNISNIINHILAATLYLLKNMNENKNTDKTTHEITNKTSDEITDEITNKNPYKPLLHILGSKWDARMYGAIDNIFETSNIDWETSVETCAGALGIHMNHCHAKSQVINDDDWNKINLYRTIQESPEELILKMISIHLNKDTFKDLKEEADKEKNQPKDSEVKVSSKIDINAAARYLYLNIVSFRHMGNTFLNTIKEENYRETLSRIYSFHEKLKDTVIHEKDIFKVINKYRKNPNTLFIVDPNYLDANAYLDRIIKKPENYGATFGLDEHKKLAKLLCSIKKNSGNDFIYFCRITVTRKKDKKNKVISDPEELKILDRDLKEKINDLFYKFKQHLYYFDVELDNGTIEGIITSFPFKDATPY